MDDLIAFLNARLDERELVAQAAMKAMSDRHSPEGYPSWQTAQSGGGVLAEHLSVAVDSFDFMDEELADHIAANDPSFVLADVAAKRAIIELAEEANGLDSSVDLDRRVGPRDETKEPYCGDSILRQLAFPYVDHPEYQESWKP